MRYATARRLVGAVATLALAGLVAGCLARAVPPLIEPTTNGPTALSMFLYRSYLTNGREPNFDERRRWQDRLDDRVTRYLRQHPEVEQSPRYMDIRGWRQVVEDSTRAEVVLLLDDPDETATDRERMKQLAEHYWPPLAGRATEVWVYPGWLLYFDQEAVVKIFKVGGDLPPSASLPSR
jgi:hypothetical protein